MRHRPYCKNMQFFCTQNKVLHVLTAYKFHARSFDSLKVLLFFSKYSLQENLYLFNRQVSSHAVAPVSSSVVGSTYLFSYIFVPLHGIFGFVFWQASVMLHSSEFRNSFEKLSFAMLLTMPLFLKRIFAVKILLLHYKSFLCFRR